MLLSHLVILIILIALICYAIPQIPISVTTLLTLLSLLLVGAVTQEEAMAGFASTAVFLIAGMMVIGRACYATGLTCLIGKKLLFFTKYGQRYFIVAMFLIVAILCAVINAVAILALMMPVIDNIAVMTNNKISRKATYFPLGIASVMGTGLSSISSSSMIIANELLYQAGYEQLGVFEPALVNLPAIIAVIGFYAVMGHDLQQKVFDFEEIEPSYQQDRTIITPVKWKMLLTGIILVGTVLAIILGANAGTTTLIASCILVLAGCISEAEAFRSISWSSTLIVGASIGISTAIINSGAALLLANGLIEHSGWLGTTTVGLCFIIFLIGTILSNVLAATSATAIMMPIIFTLSVTRNINIIPLVLACTSGCKFALATPICTANMTMIKITGYRFLDYVKIGGLVNLICLIATCAALALLF